MEKLTESQVRDRLARMAQAVEDVDLCVRILFTGYFQFLWHLFRPDDPMPQWAPGPQSVWP